MKKFIQVAFLAALIPLCFDHCKAQSPTISKHILGLDIVPLARKSMPGLMYNLKLRNGALRVRGRFMHRSTDIHYDGNPFRNDQVSKINSLTSFLALGWQKEFSKKFFGFYVGGELLATRERQVGMNKTKTEETEFSIGTESRNDTRDFESQFGVSGILGMRFRIKEEISIGLETALPVVYQMERVENETYRWEVQNGVRTLNSFDTYEKENSQLRFNPLNSFSIYLNFHF